MLSKLDNTGPTRKRRYSRGAGLRKDREWVEGIRQGNQRAFEQLYNQYAHGMHSVILQVVKDEHKAAELLQDVMMKVWKYVGTSYDPNRGGLFTWLVHVARNEAKGSFARGKKRITAYPMETELLDYYGHCQQPSLDHLGLLPLLDKLNPLQRQLVELSYLQGYSRMEIARMTGLNRSAIHQRIHQALLQLRHLLTPVEYDAV